MKRRPTFAVALACLVTLAPVGQVASAVFDMSTEEAGPKPAPLLKPQDKPAIDSPSGLPEASAPDKPPSTGNGVGISRYILPSDVLRFTGELDSRSWNVVLTKAQAEGAATLSLAYKAAIVVAPESSKVRVLVNDRVALENPIAASSDVASLSVRLPAALLHAGSNLIRIEVSQRHRTDCSIASTYDLWTEVYSRGSSLQFADAEAITLRQIEDIASSSLDQFGNGQIRVVAPALGRTALTQSIMQFAGRAALLIGEPNETVRVSKTASEPEGPGVLTAAIGTAQDLESVVSSLPSEASSRSVATFVTDAKLGSTLILSGPTDLAVSQAIEGLSLSGKGSTSRSSTIATNRWFAPDAPLLTGAARVKFSDLGVHTQEFSGRRFTTQFLIGIPSDFYASNYAQATLLLDAAYSGEVLPGSHLDVYVNGFITATTPITSYGGAILRHLPIRLLMTHFKPGANVIRFEAQLETAADHSCTTGGGANLTSRFVLFDTSEFSMPDYARMGRLPDLAGFVGTGFPYDGSDGPTALVLDNADADSVSAAATLLAKLSLTSGHVVPIEMASVATVGQRNAIFVGTASQTPEEILNQIGVDVNVRTTWKGPAAESSEQSPPFFDGTPASAPSAAAFGRTEELDTRATFDRWRRQLADGGGWRGNVSFLQDWVQRTFQLSAVNLRFLPVADVAFLPTQNSSVLLAQATSPNGEGAWTLLMAPTSTLLRDGANALVAQRQWSRILGHIVSYNPKTGSLTTKAVTTFSMLATQPFSLANLRLIAANWLSENIFAYSLALLAACLLLGLATARLVSRIGRQSP
jgi:hypothetical protein